MTMYRIVAFFYLTICAFATLLQQPRKLRAVHIVWLTLLCSSAHRRRRSHGIPQDQSSDCGVLRHRRSKRTMTHIWKGKDSSVCFSPASSSFVQHCLWTVCVCVAVCKCVHCTNERRALLFIWVWTTCLSFLGFLSENSLDRQETRVVYLHVKPWVGLLTGTEPGPTVFSRFQFHKSVLC